MQWTDKQFESEPMIDSHLEFAPFDYTGSDGIHRGAVNDHLTVDRYTEPSSR